MKWVRNIGRADYRAEGLEATVIKCDDGTFVVGVKTDSSEWCWQDLPTKSWAASLRRAPEVVSEMLLEMSDELWKRSIETLGDALRLRDLARAALAKETSSGT